MRDENLPISEYGDGQGGMAVKIIAERALALPPLNMSLARELSTKFVNRHL